MRACVKNTSFRFVLLLVLVLLLDYAGDFEDEEDNENEEDCVSGYFSHRLLRSLHGPEGQRAGKFRAPLALLEARRRERSAVTDNMGMHGIHLGSVATSCIL